MPAPIAIDADICKKYGMGVQTCPWVFQQPNKPTVPIVAFPGDCIHGVDPCRPTWPGEALKGW